MLPYGYDKKVKARTMTTSYIGKGPRGDYYEWLQLDENGMIILGEEEGNYAGGEHISPNFVTEVVNDKFYIYKNNEVLKHMDVYYKGIKEEMQRIYKKDKYFYNNIINLLIDNPVFPEKCNWWFKKIQSWISECE